MAEPPTDRELEYLQIFAAYARRKPPLPASPTLQELAAELGGKTPGGVSSVLVRLVEKGLLAKIDGLSSRNYCLTPAGKQAARRKP